MAQNIPDNYFYFRLDGLSLIMYYDAMCYRSKHDDCIYIDDAEYCVFIDDNDDQAIPIKLAKDFQQIFETEILNNYEYSLQPEFEND